MDSPHEEWEPADAASTLSSTVAEALMAMDSKMQPPNPLLAKTDIIQIQVFGQ